MTNNEIICSAAIEQGIYTEEQVEAILASGHMLPLHTFQEWKARGYSVKKGEKAMMHVDLWKYTTRPAKALREAAEAAGEELPDDPHYYKKLSHLFHVSQVRRTDGSDDETGSAGTAPAAPVEQGSDETPAEAAPAPVADQAAPVEQAAETPAAPLSRSEFYNALEALLEDENGQLCLG